MCIMCVCLCVRARPHYRVGDGNIFFKGEQIEAVTSVISSDDSEFASLIEMKGSGE